MTVAGGVDVALAVCGLKSLDVRVWVVVSTRGTVVRGPDARIVPFLLKGRGENCVRCIGTVSISWRSSEA